MTLRTLTVKQAGPSPRHVNVFDEEGAELKFLKSLSYKVDADTGTANLALGICVQELQLRLQDVPVTVENLEDLNAQLKGLGYKLVEIERADNSI